MRRFPLVVAALVVLAGLPVFTERPAGAIGLPAGFSNELITGGLSSPTAVAPLPDGTLLVTSKEGQAYAVDPATGDRTEILSLDATICTRIEQGLLGVAVDPAFTVNGFVYLYYTSNKNGGCEGGAAVNRVTRFTYDGGVLTGEVPIVDNIPSTGVIHNAGYLYIPSDGKLYVSVGDGGDRARGQSPGGVNGKILRVNLDGSAPADNPFVNDDRFDDRTYAWGLRNPFRLAFKADAIGVRFRINDVGERRWEEINEGAPGRNYGWAEREGPCAFDSTTNCGPSTFTDPVSWYAHAASGCSASLSGGAFVPDGTWVGYNGAYLFGDYCFGTLNVQRAGQTGATFEVLSDEVGRITDLRFVSEGGRWVLYYTTFANGGELHRVVGPAPARPVAPPTPSGPAKFVPVTPARILDTRIGLGVAGSPVAGQTAITLPIAGQGIVPPDASAVVLNVTGTNSAGDGFVTVWPSGEPRPTASTTNFSEPADTTANETVVPLGGDGAVQLFTQYSADLIADITGFWVPTETSSDGRFTALAPARIVDTRTGLGAPAGKVATGNEIDVQVTGAGGIPPTGVAAVALTVTATEPDGPGFVTVYPTGSSRPVVSNLNPTAAGDIRANLVIVPVGADGRLSLYTISPVHLAVDVAGWFTDGTAPIGASGLLRTVIPTRLVDTRDPSASFGRLAATQEGTASVDAVVTGGAQAVFQNLTMTGTEGPGFVTAHPGGDPVPLASNVNASAANQNRAALAVTRLSPAGTVGYFAGATATDLVVDISAWLTA